jgi:hypothetical protein
VTVHWKAKHLPVWAGSADSVGQYKRSAEAAHAFGSISPRAARVCELMNAGFLLAATPRILTLIEHGKREPTWCAARSAKDAYAFGFEPRALGVEDPWGALRLLTACVGDRVEAEWGRLVRRPPLAPAPRRGHLHHALPRSSP